MTDEIVKKTVEMEEYEEDTGKLAVWRGKISKDFLKWEKQKKKEELSIITRRKKKIQTKGVN